MNVSKPYESEAVRAVTGPTIRPGGLELTRRVAEYCRLNPGDRILDVGCGAGATVGFLNRHMNVRAVGMDLSALLLAEARQDDPEISVLRRSALALPVNGRCLAAVYCECVFSLIPAPMVALDEFSRVLQPDGYLVITDPYRRTGVIPDLLTAGSGGCLRGAVARKTMLHRTQTAGLSLCLWEDHSDLLNVLAARLVWAGISL